MYPRVQEEDKIKRVITFEMLEDVCKHICDKHSTPKIQLICTESIYKTIINYE